MNKPTEKDLERWTNMGYPTMICPYCGQSIHICGLEQGLLVLFHDGILYRETPCYECGGSIEMRYEVEWDGQPRKVSIMELSRC